MLFQTSLPIISTAFLNNGFLLASLVRHNKQIIPVISIPYITDQTRAYGNVSKTKEVSQSPILRVKRFIMGMPAESDIVSIPYTTGQTKKKATQSKTK